MEKRGSARLANVLRYCSSFAPDSTLYSSRHTRPVHKRHKAQGLSALHREDSEPKDNMGVPGTVPGVVWACQGGQGTCGECRGGGLPGSGVWGLGVPGTCGEVRWWYLWRVRWWYLWPVQCCSGCASGAIVPVASAVVVAMAGMMPPCEELGLELVHLRDAVVACTQVGHARDQVHVEVGVVILKSAGGGAQQGSEWTQDRRAQQRSMWKLSIVKGSPEAQTSLQRGTLTVDTEIERQHSTKKTPSITFSNCIDAALNHSFSSPRSPPQSEKP